MALRLQAKPAFDEWSAEDVADWLEVLGLEKYSDKFRFEDVSGRALLDMEQATLREGLGMTLGDASMLQKELKEQAKVSEAKRKPRTDVVRQKGQLGHGGPLTQKQRDRIRVYSGDNKLRGKPLTDEELECWEYQASWLVCPVSGQSWVGGDSIMGMALYHQPRFCTKAELQRRQLEDNQALKKRQEAAEVQMDENGKDVGQSEGVAEDVEPQADVVDDGGSDIWEVIDRGVAGETKPEAATASTGARNAGIGMGTEYDRSFSVYPDVEPPASMHLNPLPTGDACRRLGFIEVMVGPAFDIKAFNNGSSGSQEVGVQGLEARGIRCLDRQYNAVNFQYYVQRHPNSYARKLCTSRLSFYIEEGHGKRVFPDNILSQLSLLFYRNNGMLNNKYGRGVNQAETAECIMRAIPKILLQTVMEIVTGVGFEQYTEHAVRLYLLVHHTAIKLLSYFPVAHQRVYDKVKEWMQNPFLDDAIWGPEEAMLAASLVSVPFALMREAMVRRVLADMQGAADANCEKLLKQNQEMLSRIAFVHSFFEAGPGRLKVKELEEKYTRCAGTLPKAEREQLMGAVKHTAVESCEDWWRSMGMDGALSHDEKCAEHLMALREHVLQSLSHWRSAVRPKAPEAARREGLGAEELGAYQAPAWSLNNGYGGRLSKQQRLQKQAEELAEARRLHEGYPKLKEGKLPGTVCLYCGEKFSTRERLFTHLRKMISKERMIYDWHKSHFAVCCAADHLKNLRCPAAVCQHKTFESQEDLLDHLQLMGVPGAAQLLPEGPAEPEPAKKEETINEEEVAEDTEEQAPVEPYAALGKCFKCCKARSVLFAQCGHSVACKDCSSNLTACPVCAETISQKIDVCWS
eukprot:TRINITY_DN18841_c0_g1_i1.p1 TRINITY_DN18841_c0_g1~~TRINITY_DN18841_c0_g1_i1.p1  ORF type:complete len:859 (-),score=249.04 TRINITY_DN18841_c0_g1_i1:494-3070(-)